MLIYEDLGRQQYLSCSKTFLIHRDELGIAMTECNIVRIRVSIFLVNETSNYRTFIPRCHLRIVGQECECSAALSDFVFSLSRSTLTSTVLRSIDQELDLIDNELRGTNRCTVQSDAFGVSCYFHR